MRKTLKNTNILGAKQIQILNLQYIKLIGLNKKKL